MQNIEENNRLIVEFMGQKDEPFELPQFGYIKTNGDFKTEFMVSQLKYHSSWDWLMPVVQEIISLKNVYAEERQKVFEAIKPNKEITYKSVVEFIKWYNQQKAN